MSMGGTQGIRTVYATLGPAGTLATVVGAVAVVVVGASLWSFVRAVATPSPGSSVASDAARGSEAHKAQFEQYLAQINGRTMFVLPAAPPPPAPEVIVDNSPPPPPSKPTSYGGSPIIALVMDTVWFEDGRRMKVGDPEQNDTEVLEVRAPWEAVLRWKGEEFTVPLFSRDRVVLKRSESEQSSLASRPTETAEESDDRSGGGVTIVGNGTRAGASAGASAGSESESEENETPTTTAEGEKVTGPEDKPVQEPDHPQVVVPRPAPGEKPKPQPVPEPPPPPQTPQDSE